MVDNKIIKYKIVPDKRRAFGFNARNMSKGNATTSVKAVKVT